MLTPGFRDDFGGYQSAQFTYWYDPSVELYRAIAGRRWIVETKVNWCVRCEAQRVLLAAHSWFSPGGAYADYEYIRFQRQD